jgi:cellulose synthase/poly-beta-1,6-N-acetylglucosamine synthase-like glycosyltransferase
MSYEKLFYEPVIMVPVKMDSSLAVSEKKYKLRGLDKEVSRGSLLHRVKELGFEQSQNKINVCSIKMCVVITMYNEKKAEFDATMQGVIQAMAELKDPPYNLKENEVAIFLIADGFPQVSESQELLQFLKTWQIYDETLISEDFLKIKANLKGETTREFCKTIKWSEDDLKRTPLENVVHLFQRRTKDNFGLSDLGIEDDNVPDFNFFFAIKHHNGGKLDSHLYFFKGFCEYLNPKFTFLLDIGTNPRKKSLSQLYKYMEDHPSCGGCCGEIEVDVSLTPIISFAYPLVTAQFVEYKISHFLDKAFESLFGFCSVLPGAFCAFRWDSIKGLPLTNYFLGLDKHTLSCAQSNMYLAEDRIMCLSIITNKARHDTLAYVPGAVARTDPPDSLQKFIKQRRRWINGSTFASLFVLANFWNIWKTRHSKLRKFLITLLFVYYVFNTILTFMLVGTFYATFTILLRTKFLNTDMNDFDNPVMYLENVYIGLIILIFIWSCNKDVGLSYIFYALKSIILGFFMLFTLYTMYNYFNVEDSFSTQIVFYVLLGTFAIPIVLNLCRINHCFPFVVGFVFYLFFTPFYLNALVIYAFCNIHDCSWGNRPTVGASVAQQQQAADAKRKKDEEFKAFRTHVVVAWIFANLGISILIVKFQRQDSGENTFLLIYCVYITSILVIKLLGCILFSLKNMCCKESIEGDAREIIKAPYTIQRSKPIPAEQIEEFVERYSKL